MIPVALGLLLSTLVHLGPEVPVGTRVSGAAASAQTSPSAAWNGHAGLMVWIDQRGSYPADRPPRNIAPQMLRVSPMRADGSLVNPEGTALFPAFTAHIAANGTSFMLAYASNSGVYTVPLNESGATDGVTTKMLDGWFDYDIVSNQHTFLFVATLPGTNEFETVGLQPSGVPFAVKTFSSGAYSSYLPAITTINGVYAIAYQTAPCPVCSPEIHLALMAEDSATTDVEIADGPDFGVQMSLAASDDRLMLSVLTIEGVKTMTVSRDMKVLAPLTVIASPAVAQRAPILWDGHSFLVTWQETPQDDSSETQWKAIRVSPQNVALDAAPVVIARTYPTDLELTRTTGGIVATWATFDDVLRRTFVSNADLFTRSETPAADVLSLHAQSAASSSSYGVGPLRVWREGSLDAHIMLAIGDRTIDVASSTERDVRDPSVAAGGDVILVVWRDLPRALSFWLSVPDYRVYARRFARDGTALDAQPILLGTAGSDYVEIELGTATAFDGRNFVAIWGGSSFAGEHPQLPVHVLRISPAGTLVDSSAMLIAGVKNFGYNSGFRVVNTGGELLVAWSTWDDYRYIRGISPPPGPVTAIEVVRLDTRSTSMSVIDERELWSDADLSKQVGLAWNGSSALLASVRRGCVLATLLDAKLATVAEKTKVECGSNEHPAVAWDGGEFVVAWSADAVHAIRFDRALQPLDDAPFAVGPPGIASHEPSLAASASGVAITYERLDDDVPRLFTRELDSLGRTPRRASASRTSQ